ILCFWHARILMMPHAFRGWPGLMLISEHADGEVIAQAVARLGIASVRGSSTRGGAKALVRMVRAAREGRPLGITPDGPRGPRERVQMGAVWLAKKTGLPLRAVCYATSRYWRAPSWDRFYVPMPFSRGVFVFSELLDVRGLSDEEAQTKLQELMDTTQRRADRWFHAPH
ncbi:MAG: DUF374 domain-containing protein, partial [Zetaproteobacteria bacterium]